MGEEEADSLLTGEMSLLLLVWLMEGELVEMVAGFRGICQEGIFGTDGDAGNCLLERDRRQGYSFNTHHVIQIKLLSSQSKTCTLKIEISTVERSLFPIVGTHIHYRSKV